ncbi:PREDICTED: evolutionarily conserved signaling intermediate in Toll pathway, mitochondrial isoform X1 [Mandrillus leucophaeus]|uniref:evolutionarily conserved signaling intermediate in Toll pathway, mitochondrial isoform X1 n=1 Tax=Mandrillus leucophaeus TaxID=9568 RepID=UPI0005F46BF8|nr:PREDICTED: evolutionarily conserved signaling intermediate in Toll pathway, mitochondrial isoform X1 [Mandrillus leucophaeus]
MSWVQATLLARGLCRAWGGICGAALPGTSISQVPRQLPRGLHCSAAAHSSEQSLVSSPPEPRQRRLAGNGTRPASCRRCRNLGSTACVSGATLTSSTWPCARCGSMASSGTWLCTTSCSTSSPKRSSGLATSSSASSSTTLGSRSVGLPSWSRWRATVPLPKDSTGAADPPQPHIVGIQSPDQQAALARHNPARPIFVEGPFSLWLRNKCVYYHILRADLLPPEEREVEETPEEWNLYYPMQLDLEYSRSGWDDYEFDINEVEEGPVFAMCMAGAHDQATLAKWIQGLQETNPTLAQIPVVFRLTRATGELHTSSAGLEEPPPPEDHEEDDSLQRQQQGQS